MAAYDPVTASQQFWLSCQQRNCVEVIGNGATHAASNCRVRVVTLDNDSTAPAVMKYVISRPLCDTLIVNGVVSQETLGVILEYCELHRVTSLDVSNMVCPPMSPSVLAHLIVRRLTNLRGFSTNSHPATNSQLTVVAVILAAAIEKGIKLGRLDVVSASPDIIAQMPAAAPEGEQTMAAMVPSVCDAIPLVPTLHSVYGEFAQVLHVTGAWRRMSPQWLSRNLTVV